MFNKIKILLRPLFPTFILNSWRVRNEKTQYADWLAAGKPTPPPHIVKQKVIEHYQKKSQYQIFIETGTFLGDMVQAQLNNFNKIVSIELSDYYFQKSKKRFRRNKKVQILKGDSSLVLYDLLKTIDEPAIFWLDGHYSFGLTAKGELNCPIFEELKAIFNHHSDYNPILLIDDARLFNGENDYPTIEALKGFVFTQNKNYVLSIQDDVIRFIIK